jgi:hypothetical protein
MKEILFSFHFIPHPSYFILSAAPSLTVGLLPKIFAWVGIILA